jgi:hypothetical protein
LAYVDAGSEEIEEEKEILETQNARFNLWADNIGGWEIIAFKNQSS